MTWDHIPIDSEKTKKAAMNALEIEDESDPLMDGFDENDSEHTKFVKVNFPPFQHWKFFGDELKCVGKSHWKGDLESGEFSKDHGQMTLKFANMLLKLCDKYSSRYNFRNYSYNEEMRGQALIQLVQVGLQFDESKSNNPFSYITQICHNSFVRVLNIEKKHQTMRDDILEINGLNPSFTRQGISNSSSYDGGDDYN